MGGSDAPGDPLRLLALADDGNGRDGILELLDGLAGKYALGDLSDRLRRFRDRPDRSYTVGLLGEQPAKARMLNTLLGAAVLDPYSGLGQKRSIRFGSDGGVAWDGGYLAERQADHSWHDIRRVTESLPEVDIIVCSAALHSLGASLVDVPPDAGGVLSQHEWRSIEQCHSLVLIVQAASMLTRHEIELLYQVKYRCGPALLGILVVGLEHVEEPEHEAVVRAVRRASNKYLGELPVVACPPGDSGARELAAMVATGQRSAIALGARWLDSVQLAALISDALEQLDALADSRTAEPAAELSDPDADYLLDARLESLARSADLVESLQRDVSVTARNLTTRLLTDVRQAPDTAAWLNENLAAGIAEALAATGSEARKRIASALEKSISWLEAAARDRGIAWVRVDLPAPPDVAVPAVDFAGYTDRTAEQLRFFSRLTRQVLDVVTPLFQLHFQVPVPNPDPLVQSVFDEIGQRHRSAEQPAVDIIVRRTVRRAFDELTEDLIELIRKFDSGLIRQLKQDRERLLALRAAADSRTGFDREAVARSRTELEQALESLRRDYVG